MIKKTKYILNLDTQSYNYISDIEISGNELKKKLIKIKNSESSNERKVLEYKILLNEIIFKRDTEYLYTVIFDNYMFL